MAIAGTDSRTVVLRDRSVTIAALRLLWDLEARGVSFTVDGDDGLLVGPRSQITADDDAAIREHKYELISLVRFCESIQ